MQEVSPSAQLVISVGMLLRSKFPATPILSMKYTDKSVSVTFQAADDDLPVEWGRLMCALTKLPVQATWGDHGRNPSTFTLSVAGATLLHACAAIEAAAAAFNGKSLGVELSVTTQGDGRQTPAITEYMATDQLPQKLSETFGVVRPSKGPIAGEVEIPNLLGLGDADTDKEGPDGRRKKYVMRSKGERPVRSRKEVVGSLKRGRHGSGWV